MKIKYLVLSFFILLSASYSFSRGSGEIGSGGGLDVSNRMVSSSSFNQPAEVHIYDIRTGVEVMTVAIEELDLALYYLESGEYILVYIDSKGNVSEQNSFLKE